MSVVTLKAPLQVNATRFGSLKNPGDYKSAPCTWDHFVGLLKPLVIPSKEQAPLINGARLAPGGKRGNASVLGVSILPLDLDKVTPAELEESIRRIQAAGIMCAGHSTHSHGKDGKVCARIWIPLASEVSPEAYRDAFASAVERFAPWADPKCADPGRGYFVPSCPAERKALAFSFSVEGAALQVEPQIAKPREPPKLRLVPRDLSPDVLIKLAKTWGRSTKPEMIYLADRLLAASRGESFAGPGERDDVFFKLISRIASHFPDVSIASLEAFFERSLSRMAAEHPEGALTLSQIGDKLERSREYALEREKQKEDEQSEARRSAIRQAFGSDREHPYTVNELERLADSIGVSVGELRHLWILQHGEDFHLLTRSGRYEPTKFATLQAYARVLLAPAPIELYEEGNLATREKLIEEFSTPLADVRRSLVAQRTSIDRAQRVATLACCPIRDIVPTFDAKIDGWLKVLAGEAYDPLVAWLAFCTDLRRPLSALVLLGHKGAGKSLLARGIARIWSESGPSAARHVFESFNDSLEQCPVVFADEELPQDSRQQVKTEQIREFIQATEHKINKKFRAVSSLHGAARLIIAANNDRIFSLRANSSDEDLRALAERFFHISVGPKSEEYLESVGGRAFIDPNWINADGIAKHVLWLRENTNPVWQGRFGVAHESMRIFEKFQVRDGVRSACCEWIVNWLMNPGKVSIAPERSAGLGISNGAVSLSLQVLAEHWAVYIADRKPATAALATALQSISTETRTLAGDVVCVLNTEKLIAWADSTRYTSAEKIREILKCQT